MKNILLVSKVPILSHYPDNDLMWVKENMPNVICCLENNMKTHHLSLDIVRKELYGHNICERRADEIVHSDFINKDLIITVGGDGTVLAVNQYIEHQDIIAVNSVSDTSIGHYTRTNAQGFSDLFQTWLKEENQYDIIPRITATIEAAKTEIIILNDCLFSNHNPAAMTRYEIEIDDIKETHSSSGIWISTAAGSTAAIHSAGMDTIEHDKAVIMYKVRELYKRQSGDKLLEGILENNIIKLTPTIPGTNIFTDGSYTTHNIPSGTTLTIRKNKIPLKLVITNCRH